MNREAAVYDSFGNFFRFLIAGDETTRAMAHAV